MDYWIKRLKLLLKKNNEFDKRNDWIIVLPMFFTIISRNWSTSSLNLQFDIFKTKKGTFLVGKFFPVIWFSFSQDTSFGYKRQFPTKVSVLN